MEPATYARMASLEDRHWWFLARRQILSDMIRAFVPLPRHADVLEAGCGTGGNLPMLKTFGSVSAFEPDADARARAVEKSGLAVAAGRLPDTIPFPEEGFDLVASFDVLEHVEDDVASLSQLRSRLR